ncbi:MAG: phage holin family protein [Candidatus Baltobacteraceae bacterium]
MNFLIRLFITAIVFYLLPRFVPGIHVAGATAALIAALIFGIVNAIIRPLVLLLTLPLTLLTLGLFVIVVNALMFMLAAWIAPGFKVDGFGPALIGAIVMMVVGFIVSHTFRDERARSTV